MLQWEFAICTEYTGIYGGVKSFYITLDLQSFFLWRLINSY